MLYHDAVLKKDGDVKMTDEMKKYAEKNHNNKSIVEVINEFKDYLKGLKVIANIDNEKRFLLAKTLKSMSIYNCFTGL